MSNLFEYNASVAGWTRRSERKLKNRVLRLVLNIGPGYNNLHARPKQFAGESTAIEFEFPLHMVFVHKGAGRGYGGVKTGLFSKLNGKKGITNKFSIGKMGTGKRVAKPWFNPVIEEQFPELAEIVSVYRGEKLAIQIQRILID